MTENWKHSLTLLKHYQDHLLAVVDIDSQLADIAAKGAQENRKIEEAQNNLANCKGKLSELEKTRKLNELEAESERVRGQEREIKLYAIKTNKEYQATLKEIAQSKQIVKSMDDEIIRLMEEIEKRVEENAQLSATLADTEGSSKTTLESLASKSDELKEKREDEFQAGLLLAKEIDVKLMRAYERLQPRHKDAVGMVRGGICQGCNMRIPPQKFIELQKWEQMLSCQNCHRILYWDSEEEVTENP